MGRRRFWNCPGAKSSGEARPPVLALLPRGAMPERREGERARSQRDVRALIFELLAQLAPRTAVEELLSPVQRLALVHLDLRQQGRKEHGVVDRSHGVHPFVPPTPTAHPVPAPEEPWRVLPKPLIRNDLRRET